ncbi:hypothetical protein D3C71_1499980 [compost metagenome]
MLITADADLPGAEQCRYHHYLADQAGGLGRQSIGQQAHEKAQYCAGQNRRGDHQAALLRSQLQIGGDLHRQRPKHVPDHETQVEIEEGSKQRRSVAGFPETFIHRIPRQQKGSRPSAVRRGRGHDGRTRRGGLALVVQGPAAEATAGLRERQAEPLDRKGATSPGRWGRN